MLKEKPKVFHLVALVLSFLSAENENRQLEDLPLADFGRLPERLLPSLPDSCTEPWTCGTQASGWLRGGHPSMEEGLVHRNVCFSWNDNCCFAEVQALVRHCYGYYVYKLQPTALEFKVKARYCVENRAIPYEDALFYQPVTKTGVQSALKNHVIHKEYHVTSSWKCMAYCLSEMTCVSFSYFPQSNTCELNNSTESSNPEGLRKRPGTEYYEKTSHSSFLG